MDGSQALAATLVRCALAVAAAVAARIASWIGVARRVAHAAMLRPHAVAWALVGLGVGLRLSRYLLKYPIWGEESVLAISFFDAGYFDLIGPLQNGQTAPLLFLWTQLTIVRLLGFDELSLRLFPCLCGVVSVLIFRSVAARMLQGVAYVFAVGIFSVAYFPIRHAAEAKPYAVDLLASLLLLWLAICWYREPRQSRWIWLLAIVGPLTAAFSYPAPIIAGGIAVALGSIPWRENVRWQKLGFLAFNVSVWSACLAHLYWHCLPQNGWTAFEIGDDLWAGKFPDLWEPLHFLVWMIDEHTGRLFAYPVGGERGASVLTFVCFVVAAVLLWKQEQRALVGLMLVPLLLTMLAALWQIYPYGGSARTMLFYAPAICLLSGCGAATLLSLIRRIRQRTAVMALCVIGFWAIGLISGARDLTHPYKTSYDRNSAAFARWFWTDQAHQAELVCVEQDLKFALHRHRRPADVANYACNRRIYSPSHPEGTRAPRWDRLNPAYPLRCVVYSYNNQPADGAQLKNWLAFMEQAFVLQGRYRHDVNPGVLNYAERYEVYEFVPKSPVAAESFSQQWRQMAAGSPNWLKPAIHGPSHSDSAASSSAASSEAIHPVVTANPSASYLTPRAADGASPPPLRQTSPEAVRSASPPRR